MNISIKQRIRWSFSVLVFLFIINGIITVLTINSNKKLTQHLAEVVDPSLQTMARFRSLLIESRIYATNWVFLRSDQEDKDLLKAIHDSGYIKAKSKLDFYAVKWLNKTWVDSLNKLYTGFEQLLAIEKDIMLSLNTFEDYNDPVIKLEAERIVEEEVLPRTAALINSLNEIHAFGQLLKDTETSKLEKNAIKLRWFIIVLVITTIGAGIFLSMYLSRLIIAPVNKISQIINNLGRGIIQKIQPHTRGDEIGKMVNSVNNLSEKLHATAAFATEIGNRNFNSDFIPLSNEDSLGKALITMRDNIRSSDEKLNEAQHIAHLGSWERDIETDEMTLSDEMFNITGIDPLSFDGQFQSLLKFIHPGDIGNIVDMMENYRHSPPIPIECRIITAKGIIKEVLIQTKIMLGADGKIEKSFGIVQDVTERKRSAANLEIKNKELERKNKELEQFAYVASHDLQEPLRTTTSFVELLQQQYKGKIDEKADKYLDYITQASARMEVLIKDLLDYSRIGHKKELEQVDCNKILQDVLADLRLAIGETQANVQAEELPVISAYPTEIKQLFQNLIANAIKFRKKDTLPEIKISVENAKDHWNFSFADNGIGIEKQHRERIFIIFQRLHNRTQYKGSGIGLSHCKKIVELHNGKIWVESTPDKGSIFHFTISKINN